MSKLEKISENIGDIVIAKCCIDPGDWEDACVNGERDDDWNPTIPCVETVGIHQRWCPIIDLCKGQIINWVKGNSAELEYKSRDGNDIDFYDKNGNIIAKFRLCAGFPVSR